MKSYERLVGVNVYTVFESKVYVGKIERTYCIDRKHTLVVKWDEAVEVKAPQKESVTTIDQEYSPKDIGSKIWFKLSDVVKEENV